MVYTATLSAKLAGFTRPWIAMQLIALLSLLFLIASWIAAGHALLNKRDSRSALGWVAICLLAPYAGVFLYLMFGVNRTHTSARRLRPVATSGVRSIYRPDSPQIPAYPLSVIGLNIAHRELVPADDLTILRNGDAAYPAMLQAIDDAQMSVNISTYIFSRGKVADRFICSLQAAVTRGVDVRILLDGMGEYMSLFRIGPKLRRAGLNVKRFNPMTLLPVSLHMNLRNHRKLLIVDSALAFTGGMNIADANCLDEPRSRHCIQDLHFSMTGPIVGALEQCFLQDWHYACRKNSGRKDTGQVAATGNTDSLQAPPSFPGVMARVITDGPNEDIDKISDTLAGVITCATQRVWIMTPYFLPDAEIISAIQSACLRNLDVRVILPQKNNIPAAHRASRHQLWQLLNYGVKVYYQEAPFNHAKLLLIDEGYSMVGSANLDPRSLRLNFELNVEIFDKPTNAELAAYYEEKMTTALPYTRQDLRRRRLPVRLLDAVCWLFKPYL